MSSGGSIRRQMRLQDRVAELLGHEAGLFLPSGTMCNQIALRLHARPGGDELLLDRTAHPITSEAGGAAQVSGLMINMLDGDGGVFTASTARGGDSAAGKPLYAALAGGVGRADEQPRRRPGMAARDVREVLEVARRHGLRAHMDGARLLNAVVASGVSAADYAGGFDTAWLDFTKGLGAPGRRRPRRLARADRRGVAVEADARGRAPPVGDRGRRLPVCARPPRGRGSPRTTRTPSCSLVGWRGCRASVSTRPRSRRTSSSSRSTTPAGSSIGSPTGSRSRRPGATQMRAVTHLDVSRADVERALDAFAGELG